MSGNMALRPSASPRRFRVPTGLWLPLCALLLAELWFALFDVQSAALAPPSSMTLALVDLLRSGELLQATWQTLVATLAGLCIGGLAGLVLGTILGLSRTADRLIEVTLEVLRPVPPVALIPLSLMIFGFGYPLEASIVVFGAIWPLLILTRDAIRTIEPQLLEYAALLRLSLWSRVRDIILPAIMPQLFVAVRLATGISLILAVTVEITINPLGLGSGIMRAGIAMNPARMLAFLVWIALTGVVLNSGLLAVQKRFFDYAQERGAE